MLFSAPLENNRCHDFFPSNVLLKGVILSLDFSEIVQQQQKSKIKCMYGYKKATKIYGMQEKGFDVHSHY